MAKTDTEKAYRLEVVGPAPKRLGRTMLLVRCRCGVTFEAAAGNVRGGNTTSCGCRRLKNLKSRGHGLSRTPEYKIWLGIKRRCNAPSCPGYKNYGARGVAICSGWNSNFPAFLEHIGPRPTPDHSVERIDNSRGYEPGNVKWATKAEQSRNTRRTVLVKHKGSTLPLVDACEQAGISPSTVRMRLKLGWPLDVALAKKPNHSGRWASKAGGANGSL